jgi:hypothetical protein
LLLLSNSKTLKRNEKKRQDAFFINKKICKKTFIKSVGRTAHALVFQN